MKLVNLASISLILGLAGISESRPFNDDEKKKLRKESPMWKAPKIDEFLENNVSKKGPIYTYEFQYKNNEQNKICDVTLKKKKKADGTMESQHKWKCKTELAVDPEYQGEDFQRRRNKKKRFRRKRKDVW